MRPFKIGIALFLLLSLNLCVSKRGYVPGIIDRISIPTEGRWHGRNPTRALAVSILPNFCQAGFYSHFCFHSHFSFYRVHTCHGCFSHFNKLNSHVSQWSYQIRVLGGQKIWSIFIVASISIIASKISSYPNTKSAFNKLPFRRIRLKFKATGNFVWMLLTTVSRRNVEQMGQVGQWIFTSGRKQRRKNTKRWDFSKCWLAIAKLKPLSLFISLLLKHA